MIGTSMASVVPFARCGQFARQFARQIASVAPNAVPLLVISVLPLALPACSDNSQINPSQDPALCANPSQSCVANISDDWNYQYADAVSPPPPDPARFPPAVSVFPIVDPIPFPSGQDNTESAPGYLTPVQLIQFGTWLTRVSDNEVFNVENGRATHLYSKHQAWNADESLLDIGNHILDARTYEIISSIPLSTARNWSNVFPHLMLGVRYNAEEGTLNILSGYNISLGEIRDYAVFSSYQNCSFGDQEGNLSQNDRYVVLSCTEKSTQQKILVSYDVYERQTLGTLYPASNYNWASVSPSGNYILVENNLFPDDNPILWRYNLNFTNPTNLGVPAHGDFGVDDGGNEAYVMINGDHFFYVLLDDGRRVEIRLEPANYPAGHGHVSCRNIYRPGWCYFSSRNTGRIGAIKISSTDSLIEPWGYHYSSSSSYASAPKLTANRSGTQLLFTSDWLDRAPISDFVLQLNSP